MTSAELKNGCLEILHTFNLLVVESGTTLWYDLVPGMV